jgi:cellulose synthase/poly-beta-1,6-N-acetylglucosamine synthase-like glycosyltransferase
MNMPAEGIWWVVFLTGTGMCFLVFLGYPLVLFFLTKFRMPPEKKIPSLIDSPKKVSLLVVFRNAGSWIEKKIHNFHHLDYPPDRLELILVSDGSTDVSRQTAAMAGDQDPEIRLFHLDGHQGKIACLNVGITHCQGEIVVLTDVDAILEPDSIRILCACFQDDAVGGVCGRRKVGRSRSRIQDGQKKFIQWDTWIREMETRNGQSITSHEGKLYAIRKSLYTVIPPGVTDDAFQSLSIVRQGFRFVFDPDAVAVVPAPSRDTRHELHRRRRIVSTSLNGLWINRSLFDWRRYGFFSIGLFINKVLRRLVPVFLSLVLISSFALSEYFPMAMLFWLQVAGYGYFLSYPLLWIRLPETPSLLGLARKICAVGYFFCVGMAGTVLGCIQFFSKEKISKWDPVKE